MDAMRERKRKATEKILKTLGMHQGTQQVEDFEELVTDFRTTQRDVVVLLSKFQLYVDAIERWQRAGDELVKEIQSFSQAGKDHRSEAHQALTGIHQGLAAAQQSVAVVCNDMIDTWSAKITSPLRDVSLTYNSRVEKLVQECAKDKLDYQACRRRALRHRDAKSEGAKRTLAKLQIAQERYQSKNDFLVEELRRLQASRSELVLDEVALAAHFQCEFIRSIRSAQARALPEIDLSHLPQSDSQVGTQRREHQWLESGGSRVCALVGYVRNCSHAMPPEEPETERVKSQRAYVRNAPRFKLSLRHFGQRISSRELGAAPPRATLASDRTRVSSSAAAAAADSLNSNPLNSSPLNSNPLNSNPPSLKVHCACLATSDAAQLASEDVSCGAPCSDSERSAVRPHHRGRRSKSEISYDSDSSVLTEVASESEASLHSAHSNFDLD